MSSPGHGKGKNKRKSKGRGAERGRGRGRGRGQDVQLSTPGRSEAASKPLDETERLNEGNPAGASASFCVSKGKTQSSQEEESCSASKANSSASSKTEENPGVSFPTAAKTKQTATSAKREEMSGSSSKAKNTSMGKSKQQSETSQGKLPISSPPVTEEKTTPPTGKAATGATANAIERDVDKLTTKFGSGLATPEHTARQTQGNGGLRPPKRPDYGTVGRPIKLRANFFRLNISPKLSDLYHYDVEITPNKCPRNVKRDVVNEIVRKYKETTFQGHVPAFDGEKNLYSRIKLPVGNGQGAAELNIKLSGEDGGKDRDFKVKVQYAGQVSLTELKNYLDGKSNGKAPQDAIQALDIVMRQMPSLHFMPVGRSFFPRSDGFSCPLGEGCEVRFGFYQTVRHSEWKVPLLNIDVSAKGFSKTQPVAELVSEIFRLRPGELENPRPRKFNWNKFEQAIKAVSRCYT